MPERDRNNRNQKLEREELAARHDQAPLGKSRSLEPQAPFIPAQRNPARCRIPLRKDKRRSGNQFGFTNRPTMPAEPLARDGEPVGTIFAVTSSLVRPGGRSVGSRSVAISTKV